MAASQTGVLRILDCSKGLSDWYPPRLEDNELSEAWNVEFFDGTVCGRRFGLISRITADPGTLTYALFVHTPTTNQNNDMLALAFRNVTGVDTVNLYDRNWAVFNYPSAVDVLDFSVSVDWATLHGKLFIATKSNANRLHVIESGASNITRTGQTAPALANFSVANQGAGSFTDTRQYRIRYARYLGTQPLVRSEPSPPRTFVPSGTALAARITVNFAGADFNATTVEIEEIAPDGSWYRIAAISNPTVVYDDTLALAAVATTGILSEDIGDYTLQYSAKWLTVDEDRLLLGGSHDEESKSARVSWTPIGAGGGQGQTGVGNDERLPTDVDGFLDFDMLDGGGLTGIKAWEGKVIVFKRGQVHQMVRSSSRLRAYLPDTLSRRHGAIPYSIVEGTDENGLACLYFLDAEVGPMQLGFQGLRVLSPQMQRTWRQSINLKAAVVCSAVYHAEKRQVWWHVATGANTVPNLRWMYSVETGGLVFHSLPAPVKSGTYWLQKPTLAHDASVPLVTIIGQGDQPTMVVDYNNANPYRAYITTKAYQLGQLLRRFQIDAAVLEAGTAAGTIVYVTCRRDYGAESRSVAVPLTMPPSPALPVGLIAVPVDNSYMTEAMTMQFQIGDLVPQIGAAHFQIHGLTLAWSLGSPTTGRG